MSRHLWEDKLEKRGFSCVASLSLSEGARSATGKERERKGGGRAEGDSPEVTSSGLELTAWHRQSRETACAIAEVGSISCDWRHLFLLFAVMFWGRRLRNVHDEWRNRLSWYNPPPFLNPTIHNKFHATCRSPARQSLVTMSNDATLETVLTT